MAGVFDIELSTAGVPIDALIASMCRSARRARLADRAALYAQGEPANALFLILDGFVKTSRICEDGTEITIELLKYGDIAGAIPNRQLPSENEETARASRA
jgi:CRP/FNR family transcriptional regulator, cyclic AMP receptor protein